MGVEMLNENLEERRQFERYSVKEFHPAFVAIRPTFLKLGSLKDASLSGLGLRYTLMEKQEPFTGKETHIEVDLFV